MELSQFISSVGIARIDFQFQPELLGRCHIVWRVALPGARQKGPSDPVVDAGPPGVDGEHLAILADGCVVRSLALIGFGLCLMPPHRRWSHLRELLHVEKGAAAEDSRGCAAPL